jgi:hypothetical protein
MADATASSSFEPRQTAAFIVIWKFGLAFARATAVKKTKDSRNT